jgi:hypothetical protein
MKAKKKKKGSARLCACHLQNRWMHLDGIWNYVSIPDVVWQNSSCFMWNTNVGSPQKRDVTIVPDIGLIRSAIWDIVADVSTCPSRQIILLLPREVAQHKMKWDILMKTTVFCDVTQCSLVCCYQYLGAASASIYRVVDSLTDSVLYIEERGSRLSRNVDNFTASHSSY